MALSRQRMWICTACETAPVAVTIGADEASLCINCDIQLHPVNPPPFHSPPSSGLACSSSCTYQDDQLPGPMFDTENEVAAHTVLNQEIHEDETDSWLLLEPDNSDNQAMSGFTYGEQLDESMNIADTCTGHQCQEQCSDHVVPVQTSDAKKQPHVQQQQQTHQQLQSIYFNTEHKGSKAGFTSTPSTSPTGNDISITHFINCSCCCNCCCWVKYARGALLLHTVEGIFRCLISEEHQTDGAEDPMLLITAGNLPNATSNVPNSCTRFPMETADLFPEPLLLMPLQYTPLSREEKVLRYREKRKARKFEKRIRYAARKACAETRPRVKGRFARKTYVGIEGDQLFSKEDYDYGVVQSL